VVKLVKEKILYKCLNDDCGHEFTGVIMKDGMRCPKCSGEIVPIYEVDKAKTPNINFINRVPLIEEVKKEQIVILRSQGFMCDADLEALEEKYSKRFGCKVVVIESKLGFVDSIYG
jgi:DNA-directed RNA polymerase subunit RPC12/RpoP